MPKSIKIARWPVTRLREEVSRATAFHYLATLNLLKRNAPTLIEDFNKIFATNKDYFVHLAVSSPLELAVALAQAEQNMFGCKMSVFGDDQSASVVYRFITEWANVENFGNLTEEDRQNMREHFRLAINELGAEFGFATEIVFSESKIVVTFSRVH